jgi:hypothetical protein
MVDTPTKLAGSKKALILVCGAARSGTTMLDLMLGNDPETFSCGEIYALFRPYRTHHFDPVCSCGNPDCEVWKELRHVAESDFHEAVLNRPGISYAVDSSKDLRWVLDSNMWAQERGYRVSNVVTWKEPVDLAYSHWKRGYPINFFRKQFVDYYSRFLDLNLPFISVSYNKLAANPDFILSDLCVRLGLEYEEGREQFWSKKHHYFFGSSGTASQVEQGASKIQREPGFPSEFMTEFDRITQKSGSDRQLEEIINRLKACETASIVNLDMTKQVSSSIRPLWYYRHTLKAIIRRYFPEPQAVIK